MAAVYVSNLIINAGTDFDQIFTLENSSTDDPLNLTNYEVSSYLRKHAASSSFTAFTASIANPALGRIQVSMAASVTSELKPGRYVYDVVVTDTFGFKSKVVEGMALVREGVTR